MKGNFGMIKKLVGLFFTLVIIVFPPIILAKAANYPPAPVNFKAETVDQSGKLAIKLEWDQEDSSLGYKIVRQEKASGEQKEFIFEPDPNGIKLTKGGVLNDNEITPESVYEYSIFSYDIADIESATVKAEIKAVAGAKSSSVAAAPAAPGIPSPALSCPAKQVPTELGCVSSFGQYFSIILDWLVPALSAVAVLMAVYAGILYMTSMGNAENLEKAKTIIFSVIFGVGLLFLLEIIVRLLGIQT